MYINQIAYRVRRLIAETLNIGVAAATNECSIGSLARDKADKFDLFEKLDAQVTEPFPDDATDWTIGKIIEFTHTHQVC